MDKNERLKKAAAYMREWRANNRERAREISRAGSATYNETHRDRRLQSSQKYQARKKAEDPDGYRARVNAAARRHYAKRVATDPAYLARKIAANERWSAENLAKAKAARYAATEKWRKANPEHYRNRRRTKREQILAFFGGKCRLCGFAGQPALHLDHINGGGYRERKSGGGTIREQYRLVTSDPEAACAKYQLLCANCHFMKGH